jgi:ParB-like nuclease domain
MRASDLARPSQEKKERFVEMFRKFLPLAMHYLKIDKLPKMVFEKHLHDTHQPTFGRFENQSNTLYVALANRHPNDILRTIAHELQHFKQNTEHRLQANSGATGSTEENEANAMAGIVMRHFNKLYPEYLKEKPVIAESKFGNIDAIKKGVSESHGGGYKEIEFVCANPRFPNATDPKLQKQMYAELKKIKGVMPLFQDHSDYSEGQSSLTAIYKDSAVRDKILKLAKQLDVGVDLERSVTDDYVDRAIHGEHEGQKDFAEEASPMIKPPTNRFDNKQEAFAYAREHGGKVFRSTYIDPNTGNKNISFVVKKEQGMAEATYQSLYAKLEKLKKQYDQALTSRNIKADRLRKIRDAIIKLEFDLGLKEGVAEASGYIPSKSVKLYTDPDYYGADVDDTNLKNLPTVNIPLDKLVGYEPDSKMNSEESKKKLKNIISKLKQKKSIPPILVRQYNNGYQVLDGHHRYHAYKLLNKKTIPAKLVPDTDIETMYQNPLKQGVAEGSIQINEIRQASFQYIKSLLPKWPDYVLKDLIYPLAKGEHQRRPNWRPTSLQPFELGFNKETILFRLDYWGLSPDTQWKFIPKFHFEFKKMHPDTQQQLRVRAGGAANPYNVPRDAERHAKQAELAKTQGGIRKEPIIGIMTTKGFELLEGWHRTIQHFNMYPNGYYGPAWVAETNIAEETSTDQKSKKQILIRIRQILYDRKLSGTISNAGELHRLRQQLKDLRNKKNISEDNKHLSKDDYEDLGQELTIAAIRKVIPSATINFDEEGDGYVEATSDGLHLHISGNIDEGSYVIAISGGIEGAYSSRGRITKIIQTLDTLLRNHYGKPVGPTTLTIDHDVSHGAWEHIAKKLGMEYDAHKINENFADKKIKGKSKPGRVKRAGASCKGSVSDLRVKAKKYSGERSKMYHWCANMKNGKKKINESKETPDVDFLNIYSQLLKKKYPGIKLERKDDILQAEDLYMRGSAFMQDNMVGVDIEYAATGKYKGCLVPAIKQTTELLLAKNPNAKPTLLVFQDNSNGAWQHIADKLGYQLNIDMEESINESTLLEADNIVFVGDKPVEILISPGYQRMVGMAQRQSDHDLRLLYIPTQDIVVVWPALDAVHYDMAQALVNQFNWDMGENLQVNMITGQGKRTPISAKFRLSPPIIDSKGQMRQDTNMHRRVSGFDVVAAPKFFDLEWFKRIQRTAPPITETWTNKYKRSIDCSRPRGFSQRAHCAARRKRRAGSKTQSPAVK